MNSLEEIKDFLKDFKCSEPVFKITKDYRSIVKFQLPRWEAKELLFQSLNPLERFLGANMIMVFDKETRQNKVEIPYLIDSLYGWVESQMHQLAEVTSSASQPKRTKMYKEMVGIFYENKRNDVFVNEVLPIINYYNKALTDSKTNNMSMDAHKSNVQALFNLLRKKYGRGTGTTT